VLRSWGITGQEITGRMARERVLETREGVMVSSVRSGGPAQTAEPPLAAGDVIRAIDKVPVADLPALLERYDRIMASDELPEYLLVEFDRGGKNHVTLLKPRPEEDEPPPREVPKAWIGVATQPVIDKLARQLGHPGHLGYRITRVYPGTLAAGADLRVGDIIIALNGEKIRPRGMEDSGLLATAVRRLKVDDTAMLTVLRGGEPVKVALALERTRLTPEEARRERDRDFELTVRELTFFDRDQNRWATTVKGVWVEQVESAGWAGLGGITSGDLIQRIDDHEIKGLKSFKTAMAEIKKRQPPRVVVVVLRGVQARFQYLEPDWKPTLPKKARAGQRKDE
jgi:serine protease Do